MMTPHAALRFLEREFGPRTNEDKEAQREEAFDVLWQLVLLRKQG